VGFAETSDPCPNITGMAHGAKAMDCFDPGYNSMAHLLDNIGADNVRFSADELKQFNIELAKIEIKGERLPKFVLDFSDVEAPPKK
jgi:chemotaxis receptor (MCP) glutamine deamidase CheD